jgi:hypothetical protein
VTVLILIQNRWTLAFGCSLLALALQAAPARADTPVNTENQILGVAPRLELEAGVNVLVGFGGTCRYDEVGGMSVKHCTNGMATAGGQLAALLRPWNHLAFGPAFGYGVRIGKQRFSIDDPAASADSAKSVEATYNRHMWRLALEARWYERSVAVGGLFVGFQLGVTWFTETLTVNNGPDSSLTQTAPIIGLAVGGSFLPYRGLGMSMAVQSYLAFLPTNGETLIASQKSYGYGTFAFIGATVNFATGVRL